MSLYTVNVALKFHYTYSVTQNASECENEWTGTKPEEYVYRNIDTHSDIGSQQTSQIVIPVNSFRCFRKIAKNDC